LRALSVNADAIVFVSRVWQTTCTAVRAGDEGFVIDSPVFPDELEAVPAVLDQAAFPVSGLLVTHADWDHVLGRLAYPDVALGCGEATAARLNADPGAAARELRAFDEEHYVSPRPPLALDDLQPLPAPGRLALGSGGRELELHPAAGHTADGIAFWLPWLGVLVAGDYLSPVEIPVISSTAGGSVAEYAATLERLRPLVAWAETVVPGHGGPLAADRAMEVLDEDVAYLEALRAEGTGAALPAGRRGEVQRRIHVANATLIPR
jgi:glyoxylase-like metal-dependent hydrolase (beta-lactamase superfamily II)